MMAGGLYSGGPDPGIVKYAYSSANDNLKHYYMNGNYKWTAHSEAATTAVHSGIERFWAPRKH